MLLLCKGELSTYPQMIRPTKFIAEVTATKADPCSSERPNHLAYATK